MKLLLLSDLHLLWKNPVARKDNLPDIQFEKLEFVLDYAQEKDCIILQAGDMFDRPRSYHLLSQVMDIIGSYEVPIYCVYGQHDTYLYSKETRYATNLGILERSGLVHILNDKGQLINGIILHDNLCYYY